MTLTPVTLLYAGLLALLYMVLLRLIVKLRHNHKIGHGDGDNMHLRSGIRAHANFAEYVPFLLLMLLIAELNHTPTFILDGSGLAILISRSMHAYGLIVLEHQDPPVYKGRYYGTVITFWLFIFFAISAFGWAIAALLLNTDV